MPLSAHGNELCAHSGADSVALVAADTCVLHGLEEGASLSTTRVLLSVKRAHVIDIRMGVTVK